MKLHFMLLFILINNTSQHGGVPKNIKKVRWPWQFKKKYIYNNFLQKKEFCKNKN